MIAVHGTQDPITKGECVSELGRNSGQENAVVIPIQNATRGKSFNGKGFRKDGDPMYTLDTASQHAVAFAQNSRDEVREMPYVGALAAQPGMKQTSFIRDDMRVRRLTPEECERLMGFPDNFTRIPWRKKDAEDCPDGPRYKCLGNSWAVPCAVSIGEAINAVESKCNPSGETLNPQNSNRK